MRIYKLTTEAHRYSNLAFANDVDARLYQQFEGSPLLSQWSPAPVVPADEDLAKLELGDLSLLGTIPVLSNRAVERLSGVLSKHGELLPLMSDFGVFFAFNVTTVLNALDERGSDVVRFSSGEIMTIKRFAFDSNIVGDSEIFKIPQKPKGFVFVTDRFVRRIQSVQLVGFAFAELWSS